MSKPPQPSPPSDRPVPPAPPKPPGWRQALIPLGVAITLILLALPLLAGGTVQVGYAALVRQIQARHVQTLTLTGDGSITGTYRDSFERGAAFASHYPTGVQGPDQQFLSAVKNPTLVPEFTATGVSQGFLATLLSFLPLLLLVAYFVYIGRAARRGGGLSGGVGGALGVGRSRAKLIEGERPDTTFADVAGYGGVKRDVAEVVEFLKHPDRFQAAGAIGPRGVLMSGPPGTGKTLLARAVAGEAGVPFFVATGSGFVELFVGVGASRVRDLFEQARKKAPAIVFIDEIDAIGGRRGGGYAQNDEREQTLNQLLAEMDGFDPATGVVVLAATNRPETLDPALLRPGRFDRQVAVPLPNQAERRAILGVHGRGKQLEPDVDLDVVARATPGFSGADLANLMNEGAIAAVRRGGTRITGADLASARDRIVLGERQPSGFLLDSERRNVAVHESGHALIAVLTEGADPVDKVTILPSGMALGVTEQLPEEERHLYTEAQLRASLAVRLGGRSAELVVFEQGSTGASNDLAGATELATRMVTEFGLSTEIGPVGYASGQPQYLGVDPAGRHPYSDETQRTVDQEVARLLRESERYAIDTLQRHRPALDALTARLLEHETVDGQEVEAIAHGVTVSVPALPPAEPGASPARERPARAVAAASAATTVPPTR